MRLPSRSSRYRLGLVQRSDRVPALAPTSDHPSLDPTTGPMRVTSGKSRVRKSRTPGSVRAKPNGPATRPRPHRPPQTPPIECFYGLIETEYFSFAFRSSILPSKDKMDWNGYIVQYSEELFDGV
jgi:hypothetical protein